MTEEKKEELKKDEVPSGDVQPEKTPEKEKTQEEILAEENAKLKEENEKTKEENTRLVADNTNYKQKIKNDTVNDFTLEEEPETPPETPATPTDDEKAWDKVKDIAKDIAKETFVGQSKKEVMANEKVAKKLFFAENQEVLANPAMQAGIKEYYINRHGKTPEGIKLDMQDALNLYKINNGIAIGEEKPEETPPVEIPNMPTGGGEAVAQPGDKLSDTLREVKNTYCNDSEQELSDDAFLRYYKAVRSGERSAPQEVVNLFNQST